MGEKLFIDFEKLIHLKDENQEKWLKEFESLSTLDKTTFLKVYTEVKRIENRKKRMKWTFNDWVAYERNLNVSMVSKVPVFPSNEDINLMRKKRINQNFKEEFIFFNEKVNNIFLTDFQCNFIAPSYFREGGFKKSLIGIDFQEEIEFNSIKQYVVFSKAMIMLDFDLAKTCTKVTGIQDLNKLEKRITNFNNKFWDFFKWRIVYMGNKFKFSQNSFLEKKLFSTKGTTLVFTSLEDKLWGIGLQENDKRALKCNLWRGQNLLGEILTELRIDFMNSY